MWQMSNPRKPFSTFEIHRVESGTVAWDGWLMSEGGVVAIAAVLPVFFAGILGDLEQGFTEGD